MSGGGVRPNENAGEGGDGAPRVEPPVENGIACQYFKTKDLSGFWTSFRKNGVEVFENRFEEDILFSGTMNGGNHAKACAGIGTPPPRPRSQCRQRGGWK